VSPIARPPLTAPVADEDLLRHRGEFVTSDLPALDPNMMQHGVQHIATTLGHLAMETQLTREEAAHAREAHDVRTVEGRFRLNTQFILRYCNVQTVAQLPEMWEEVAWADKAQVPTVLQQIMEAASLQVTGHQCKFQVSTALANKIISPQNWRSLDLDDLSNGLTLFILAPRTPMERRVQQHKVDVTTIVYSGTTATLQDAVNLLEDDKARVPLDWTQAKVTLNNYLTLFHGMIGHAHPLVQEMRRLMAMFNAFELRLGRMQPPAHVSYLDLPTLVIHWVQVRVASWLWRQYEQPGLADLPDMGELFTRIEMNDPSWIPLMPTHLLPSVQLGIRPSVSLAPTLSLASGATATSTLTPATVLNTGTPLGIRINNPMHDMAFDQYRTRESAKAQAVRQKATKNNTALPNRPDGRPICLAYHVKGMCNTNCAHSQDHVARTPAENQALLAWCRLHWNA